MRSIDAGQSKRSVVARTLLAPLGARLAKHLVAGINRLWRVLCLAPMVWLAACQSIPATLILDADKLPAVGSRLTLMEPLPVPADSARSIVQYGQFTTQPDLHTPWCTFHVYRTREEISEATHINAGEFKVLNTWLHREFSYLPNRGSGNLNVASHNTSNLLESISGASVKPTNLADASAPLRFRRWNEEVSNVTFSTMIEVQSVQDNSVHRIVCSVFEDPAWERYPMLSDIRKALGDKVLIADGLQ